MPEDICVKKTQARERPAEAARSFFKKSAEMKASILALTVVALNQA